MRHLSFVRRSGGDQGILNQYFSSNWNQPDRSRRLPFTDNVTSSSFYSYLPAVNRFDSYRSSVDNELACFFYSFNRISTTDSDKIFESFISPAQTNRGILESTFSKTTFRTRRTVRMPFCSVGSAFGGRYSRNMFSPVCPTRKKFDVLDERRCFARLNRFLGFVRRNRKTRRTIVVPTIRFRCRQENKVEAR